MTDGLSVSNFEDTFDEPNLLSAHYRSELYSSSLVGDLHIGYGRLLFHRLYLGATILGTFFNGKTSFSRGALTEDTIHEQHVSSLDNATKVKLNTVELDVDGNVGVALSSKALLTSIIGAAFNTIRLDASTTATWNDLNIPQTFSGTIFMHSRKSVVGLRLGAKLTSFISDHIALGLEYIWTDYGRISASGNMVVANANSTSNPFSDTSVN